MTLFTCTTTIKPWMIELALIGWSLGIFVIGIKVGRSKNDKDNNKRSW